MQRPPDTTCAAVVVVAVGSVAWRAFSAEQEDEPPGQHVFGAQAGLATWALLFLESSVLGFPNVLARWTGVDDALWLAPEVPPQSHGRMAWDRLRLPQLELR